ncbi:MAG: hypothetical protein NT080_05890 [Spirochaetes bacterium]|nr:hypothetical protein [Spirochaetota bacterium]
MHLRNRIVSIVAASAVFLSAVPLHAEDVFGVRGFDEKILEYSIGSADRALEADSWMAIARTGAAYAAAAWERSAAALYDDVSAFESDKTKIQGIVAGEVERRFAEWLADRFFGNMASDAGAAAREGARSADRALLYETVDGRILRDERGDPIVKNRGSTDDIEAWRTAAHGGASGETVRYLSAFESELPELLAYAEPGRRDKLALAVRSSFDRVSSRAASEVDAILTQEEREFVAARLTDVYSERAKSEEETASAIATRSIAEAMERVDASERGLEEGIVRAEAGVGDLEACGESWLAMYREQFDRGIRAWERAEESFLMRRAEWERTAQEGFSSGEKAWAEAFARIDLERAAWRERISAVLDGGRTAFARAGAELASSIDSARAEFDAQAATRSQAASRRAGALADTFARSGCSVRSAAEGGSFWMETLVPDDAARPVFSDALLDTLWFDADALAAWDKLLSSYVSTGGGRTTADLPVIPWIDGKAGLAAACLGNIAATERQIDALYPHGNGVPVRPAGMSREEYDEWDPPTLHELNGRLDDLEEDLRSCRLAASGSLKDSVSALAAWKKTSGAAARNNQADLEDFIRTRYPVYFDLAGMAARTLRSGTYRDSYDTDGLSITLDRTQERSLIARCIAEYESNAGDGAAASVRNRWTALWEAESWAVSMRDQKRVAAETRTELEAMLADALGEDADSLRSVLASDPDGFHLDEYQVELLRAKATESYWNRRLAEARAVDDYARDLSSGRATSAESDARYAAALSTYEGAKDGYSMAVTALEAASKALDPLSAAIVEARDGLEIAAKRLEEAERSYADRFSVLASGSDRYQRELLQEKFSELYGCIASDGDGGPGSLTAAYTGYYAALDAYGALDEVARAEEGIDGLLTGCDDPYGIASMPSFRELSDAAAALELPYGMDALCASCTDYGLDELSPDGRRAQALIDAARTAAPGTERDRALFAFRAFLGTLRAEAQASYEGRRAAIRSCASPDSADWYAAETGRSKPAGDILAILDADAESARLAWFARRANLEIEALDAIAEGREPENRDLRDALALNLRSLSPADAVAQAASLRLAADALGSDDPCVALAELACADAFVGDWLDGRSVLSGVDGDPLAGLLCGAYGTALSAAVRRDAARSLFGSARAFAAERKTAAAEAVSSALATLGAAEGSGFRDALEAAESVFAGSASERERENRLTAVILKLDEAAALDDDGGMAITGFRDALVALCAAAAEDSGIAAIPGDPQAEAAPLADRIARLRDACSAIGSGGIARVLALYGLAAEASAGRLPGVDPAAVASKLAAEAAASIVRAAPDDVGDMAAFARGSAKAVFGFDEIQDGGLLDGITAEAVRLSCEAAADPSVLEAVTPFGPRDSFAVDLAQKASAESAELSETMAGISIIAEYRAARKMLPGSGIGAWRGIGASDLAEEDSGKVTSGAAILDAAILDAECVATDRSATLERLAFIELYNEAYRAASRADDRATGTPSAESAVLSDELRDRTERAIAGVSWIRDESLAAALEGATTALSEASSELGTDSRTTEGSKEDMARLVAILRDAENLLADPATIAAAEADVKALDAAFDDAMATLLAASDAYAGAAADRDGTYRTSKDTYAALETARADFDVAESIRDWAKNAYLAAEGDDAAAAAYRSPASLLAEAQVSHDRAAGAVRVLENLYAAETERGYDGSGYTAALAEYRRLEEARASVSKTGDELAGAIGAITRELGERRGALLDAYGSFASTGAAWFDDDGKLVPQTDDKGVGKTGWQGYVRLDANGWLELSIDESGKLVETDESARAALRVYMEDGSADLPEDYDRSAHERAVSSWAKKMRALSAASNRSAVLRQWGLAADFLRRRIAGANGKDTLDAAGISVGTSKLDEQMGVSNTVTGKSLDGQESNFWNVWNTEDRDRFRDPVRDAQEAAWEAVKGDELFTFYAAMKFSGLANAGLDPFFDSSTQLLSYRAVKTWYDGEIAYHKRQISSLRWVFFHPVAAGLLVYHAATNNRLAEERSRVKADIEPVAASVNGSVSRLATGLGRAEKEEQAYEAARARLAAMKGSDQGSEPMTRERFLAAARDAYRKTQKREMPASELAALEAQAGEYFARFGTGGTSPVDTTAILLDMNAWFAAKSEAAFRNFESTATTAFADAKGAETAYRAAYDAYLAGTGSEASLTDTAKGAWWGTLALKRYRRDLAETSAAVGFAKIGSGEGFSDARLEAVNELAVRIGDAVDARLQAERQAREIQWNERVRELTRKRGSFEERTGIVVTKANADWNSGREKIAGAANAWRRDYADGYGTKSDAWTAEYAGFLGDREDWLSRAAEAGSRGANDAILASLGIDAEARERDLAFSGASGIGIAAPEAGKLADELLGRVGFADAAMAIRALAEGGRRFDAKLARGSGGPGWADSGRIQAAASGFAWERTREAAAGNALILAENARRTIAELDASYRKQVDRANDGFGDSMDRTFASGGYIKSGNAYVKDLVVTSTLLDSYVTERTSVEAYRPYIAPALAITTKLDIAGMAGMDAWGIQGMIERAQDEVTGAFETIFGAEGDKGSTKAVIEWGTRRKLVRTDSREIAWEDPDGHGRSVTRTQTILIPVYETETCQVQNEERNTGAGEYGLHIGYAPLFKDQLDLDKSRSANLVDAGTGELGRLLKSYQWNAMLEGKGYAEAGKPFYDKKAWDDRGSWLKAPTIRSVADIGVGIAATLAVPGGGLAMMAFGAGINLADDAVFTALDIGSGAKGWEQAGLDFGKKALSSVATSATGAVFNGFQGGTDFWNGGLTGKAADTGFGGVIGRTMLTGMRSGANLVSTSAINTVQWDGAGFGWSQASFSAELQGGGAGILSGMASTFATGSLGLWNMQDANGMALSSNVFDVKGIRRLNGLAGSVAGQGVGYAMTGNASFNVLNLGDLTNGAFDHGLFELGFGNNGFSGQFGSGGADVGMGTIAGSFQGLMETMDITRMRTGGIEGNSSLNAVNGMGYSNVDSAIGIAKRIKSGSLGVSFSTELDAGEYGYFDRGDDPASMTISSDFLGMGVERAAKLAALYSHEGDHAVYGERVEANAYALSEAVYSNIGEAWSRYGLELDGGFAGVMNAAQNDPGNWNENPGDVDFWKMRSVKGRLVLQDDGYRDIRADDGTLLKSHDEVLYDRILEKQRYYSFLMAKGDSSGDLESIAAELASLRSEYDKGNQTDATRSDRVLLSRGLTGSSAGADLALRKEWVASFEADGFLLDGSGGLQNKAGNGRIDPGDYSIDITDSILALAGLDTRAILGNTGIVDDPTFGNIHNRLALGAAIGNAQALLPNPETGTGWIGGDKLERYLAYGRNMLSGMLGIGKQADSYDGRLRSYGTANSGIVDRKMEIAQGFRFETQNALSDKLGWGYLTKPNGEWKLDADGNKISSLCHALSILTAVELDTMVDTDYKLKEAFLNDAKTKGMIEKNGYVNVDIQAFSAAYVEYINKSDMMKNAMTTEKMLSPLWAESSRFGVGRNTSLGHSVIIDRFMQIDSNGNRKPYYNPWNTTWGDNEWYAKKPFVGYY